MRILIFLTLSLIVTKFTKSIFLGANLQVKIVNLFLIITSSLLPIFISDLILKNLRLPKDSNRLMLLAGSSLYSSAEGFRRYESNKNIEQFAIYDKYVAYRYSYKSNNLGLVSYPDINKGVELDLVINGDSFSEGQGGFPWVVEWQKKELKKKNLLSLNYAIAGNGFGDFLRASINASNFYNAKKNIIFFIEHDAYRPYQKMSKNNYCSFYSNGILDKILGSLTCKTYGIVWHHVGLNKSDSAILNNSKYLQQYGVLPSINKVIKKFKNFYNKKNNEIGESNTKLENLKTELRYGPIPSKTKLAIKEINKIYGNKNVLFVQLPNTEGKPGKNARFFTKLLSEVDNNNVINLWEICPLDKSDFNKFDNHPNINGYKKIKACIVENRKINDFIKK